MSKRPPAPTVQVSRALIQRFVSEGMMSETVAGALLSASANKKLLAFFRDRDIPLYVKRAVVTRMQKGMEVDLAKAARSGRIEMQAKRAARRVFHGEAVEMDLGSSAATLCKFGDGLEILYRIKSSGYSCRILLVIRDEYRRYWWATKFDTMTIERIANGLLGRKAIPRVSGIDMVLAEDGRSPVKLRRNSFLNAAIRKGIPPLVGLLLEKP